MEPGGAASSAPRALPAVALQRRRPLLLLPPLLGVALSLHGCGHKDNKAEPAGAGGDLATATVTTTLAKDFSRAHWDCHHYEGDQGHEWCTHAGVQGSWEYKFFGMTNSPCGPCWCCKRHTGATSTTTTTSRTTAYRKRLGSFMVLGDWGWDATTHGDINSATCQQTIADRMAEVAADLGDLKFVVNVGDSFYPAGLSGRDDPQWETKWKKVYPPLVRSVPWYSVYGNHDYLIDPCVCSDKLEHCAQVNSNASNLDRFYMPDTSYYVEHPELKLEVVALDLNYYTWVENTCPYTACPKKCETVLKKRGDDAFELFYKRAKASAAQNLVVFSHYPTDYFWGFPEFLDVLRNNSTEYIPASGKHLIEYFGGHRHNVDQRSTTSIAPNNNWVVGGGGGWGCEAYGREQGFVVGEISEEGAITTYPVLVDFSVCCKDK